TPGAGFVTEAGDEIGTFIHDLSVHNVSAKRNLTTDYGGNYGDSAQTGKTGDGGEGFWFEGHYGLKIENNAAFEFTDAGYYAWSKGLFQAGISPGGQLFWAMNINDPSLNPMGAIGVNPRSLPMTDFVNNLAAVGNEGLYVSGNDS